MHYSSHFTSFYIILQMKRMNQKGEKWKLEDGGQSVMSESEVTDVSTVNN